MLKMILFVDEKIVFNQIFKSILQIKIELKLKIL